MQLIIVLVAPSRAENIGAAARAMKTMGFASLRIVDSNVHLQPPARWLAHGAGDILDGIQTFANLKQALADVDFTVASTARGRGKYYYYCTPEQLQQQLTEKQQWCQRVALVFGPEESGLSNDDLALADLLTSIPMRGEYPSLNLGQAVMLYCYQLSALQGVAPSATLYPDQHSLTVLRQRIAQLLVRVAADSDQKLTGWLDQRLGYLNRRDLAMLHTLLHDVETALSVDNQNNSGG